MRLVHNGTDFLRRHAHAFGNRTGGHLPAGDNQLHRVASALLAQTRLANHVRHAVRLFAQKVQVAARHGQRRPRHLHARQSAEFARTRRFQVEQRPVASRVAQRRHAAFQGLVRPLRRAERAQGRRFIDVVNPCLRRRVKFQMDVRVDQRGQYVQGRPVERLGFRISPFQRVITAEPRDSSFPHEQAVRAAVSSRLINRAGFD